MDKEDLRYFKKFYERMSEDGGFSQRLQKDNFVKKYYERIINENVNLLNLNKDDFLLDVGCADGVYLQRTEQLAGKQIGVDISLNYLSLMKKNTKNTFAVVADIENLPFKESYFSKVLGAEVLEHVSNPMKALKELVRVSKGEIVVSTAPFNGLARKIWLLFVDKKKINALEKKSGHINEFDASFIKEIKKSFNVKKIRGSGIIQFPRSSAPEILRKKFLQNYLAILMLYIDALVGKLPYAYLLGNRLFIKISKN